MRLDHSLPLERCIHTRLHRLGFLQAVFPRPPGSFTGGQKFHSAELRQEGLGRHLGWCFFESLPSWTEHQASRPEWWQLTNGKCFGKAAGGNLGPEGCASGTCCPFPIPADFNKVNVTSL
ncbi:hypothetical protein GN956_G5591 [Arapaima gigas]